MTFILFSWDRWQLLAYKFMYNSYLYPEIWISECSVTIEWARLCARPGLHGASDKARRSPPAARLSSDRSAHFIMPGLESLWAATALASRRPFLHSSAAGFIKAITVGSTSVINLTDLTDTSRRLSRGGFGAGSSQMQGWSSVLSRLSRWSPSPMSQGDFETRMRLKKCALPLVMTLLHNPRS